MAEYTDKQKTEALELLDTQGIWAAVSATGAHHTTIYRWHAQAVRTGGKKAEDEAVEAELQTITRQRLRRRLLETALAHVDRSDAARDATDTQKYATAAGILIDKFRLEMGEFTTRTYHEGSDDTDRRIAQLVAEMESRSQAETQ